MRIIAGDSFGQAQANQQSAINSDRNYWLAKIAAAQNDRQIANSERARAFSEMLGLRSQALNEADAVDTKKYRDSYFNWQKDRAATNDDLREREFGFRLNLADDAKAERGQARQDRLHEALYEELKSGVGSGGFESPQMLPEYAQELPEMFRERLGGQMLLHRMGSDFDRQASMAAAEMLSRQVQSDPRIKTLLESLATQQPGDPIYNDTIDKLQSEFARYAKGAMQSYPGVAPDFNNYSFRSSVPASPWRDSIHSQIQAFKQGQTKPSGFENMEGAIVQNRQTGKYFKVINGVPVPL